MYSSSMTHGYTAMHTFHYLATFYSFLTHACYSILLHYTIHASLLCLINTFSRLVYAILYVDMLIQTSLHFVYIYVVAQSSHVCHQHILTACIYMYVVPHRPHCKQPGNHQNCNKTKRRNHTNISNIKRFRESITYILHFPIIKYYSLTCIPHQ